MVALHPTTALRALADVDVEPADDRPLHGQFFLILRRHPRAAYGRGAVRAGGGQRRRVRLVDVRRRAPMGARTIGGAGLVPRPSRLRDARATRERRRLAIDGAPRRVEFVFQFLVFAPQPLPLRLRPPQVFLQLRDATRVLVDDLLGIARWCSLVALRHAPVMPDSRAPYKRELRVSAH